MRPPYKSIVRVKVRVTTPPLRTAFASAIHIEWLMLRLCAKFQRKRSHASVRRPVCAQMCYEQEAFKKIRATPVDTAGSTGGAGGDAVLPPSPGGDGRGAASE